MMNSKTTQESIAEYKNTYPHSFLARNKIGEFLRVEGWKFHRPSGEFPFGIYISPQLAASTEWKDCLKRWGNVKAIDCPTFYTGNYIRDLIKSVVFERANDWSNHFVKL